MLNEQELEVVKRCRVFQFGAYLQYAYSVYNLEGYVSYKIEYPKKKEMKKIIAKMTSKYIEFQVNYKLKLGEAVINPIRLEQRAWFLLQPHIKSYMQRFNDFLIGYSDKRRKKRQKFLSLIKDGYELHKKWNIISQLYKPKLEMTRVGIKKDLGDRISEREGDVKKLIDELSAQNS